MFPEHLRTNQGQPTYLFNGTTFSRGSFALLLPPRACSFSSEPEITNKFNDLVEEEFYWGKNDIEIVNINNTKFIIIVVGMNCQIFVVSDVLKLTIPIPGPVIQTIKIQTDRKLKMK